MNILEKYLINLYEACKDKPSITTNEEIELIRQDMKISRILIWVGLIGLTIMAVCAFKIDTKTNKAPEGGFAVVELFTSEGCSSCPPADALVAKILKEDKDKAVYILGYHVDYWNHLGWKDEFSKAEYSQRQRRYASWLKIESVYTPQIVVNGTKEFVGSDEGTLRSAIQSALQKTTNNQLVLSNVRFTRDALSLQYQTKNTANRALLVAFVQKNAQSHVNAGENSGHTLSHVNIVRNLNTLNLSQQSGTQNIKLPTGFNNQTWEVIGFVQNTLTGEILSAQKIQIAGA
jgi:hypothetical protein